MKTKPVIKSSTNTALCSLKVLLLESHALILSWLDRRLLKSSFISNLIWISKGEINKRVAAFSLFHPASFYVCLHRLSSTAQFLHARIRVLTRLEQLDSLGALVRLLGVLLLDVVVDLRLRRQGLQPLQNPGDELCHVGGGGGLRVGQGHVYHEDVGQHTGEGERGMEDRAEAERKRNKKQASHRYGRSS